MSGNLVFEATETTFERDVVERSRAVPVVVDFWAEWCGPCRTLGPVLERLAAEANGDWVLAKVDVDSNPYLSSAFGIQGIPAVKAFRGGRMVAEFTGALPEPQVRAWLSRLGPSPADRSCQKGAEQEERGRMDEAAIAYTEALALEPAHPAAKSGLARVQLAQRVGSHDEGTIRARLETVPGDVSAVTAVADVEFSAGRIDDALTRLVELVRDTSGEDRERARTHLLSLLDILPPGDPRAVSARRALSMALF